MTGLLRSLYNVEERLKWDKNVVEMTEIAKQHPNMSIVLYRNAKMLFFDARQFIDKRIIFRDEEEDDDMESIYVYSTSIPKDKAEDFLNVNPYDETRYTYVTANTIISIYKITYDKKSGGSVRVSMYNQVDPKLGYATKLAAMSIPKITSQWFTALNDYLQDEKILGKPGKVYEVDNGIEHRAWKHNTP